MTDTAVETVDGPFRLNPDGTAEIDQDGTTYKLRRPKLGQFRELKSHLNDLNKYIKGLEGDAVTSDDVQDEIMTRRAAILEAAFKALSSQAPPSEFDTWLVMDNSVLRRLLTHWQTVPLARG